MPCNKIKFSHLWDKLNDAEFTTIRSWNQGKEEYYRTLNEQEFQVWKIRSTYPFMTEHVICHAWLKGVQVVVPRELPEDSLEKDVTIQGKVNRDWMEKLMKMDKALLLLFSRKQISQTSLGERIA